MHHCGACGFNKPVLNALSIKLEKHGYGDDLHLFRIENSNVVPYLGEFAYTPMYIFLRKDE